MRLTLSHGASERLALSLDRATLPAARQTAPFWDSTLPPDAPVDEGPSATGKRLRAYQVAGADWLRRRKRGLLGDDPGTGKSAEVLRALGPRARAVVVCPAHLKLVWADEIAEWRPDLTADLRSGLRQPKPGEVVVLSYEALPPPPRRLSHCLRPEVFLRGTTVVFDEAHYAKNPDAERSERSKLLARQAGRVWILTGTPMLGSPLDLWGVLCAFGLEREAYGTPEVPAWTSFKAAFRTTRVGRGKASHLEWGDPLPAARVGLKRVMLRRTRDEVLGELPPVVRRVLRVPAPDDLRALLDETLGAWDSWGDPTALPPFELLSASLSALAAARTEAVRAHVHSSLAEGTPILVGSAFRAPVCALQGTPRTAVVTGPPGPTLAERKALVDKFQRGELDCLAGTFDSMGTGFTLTRAARVLFVDEDYTPSVNEQFLGRALRHGQKQSVLVEVMRSDHAIDQRRADILRTKTRRIGKVV